MGEERWCRRGARGSGDVCAGVGQAHEDLHVVRLNLVAFPEVTKEAFFYLPLLNQHSLQIAGHLQTPGARGRRRAQAEREADRVEKGGGEEHWSAGRTRAAPPKA